MKKIVVYLCLGVLVLGGSGCDRNRKDLQDNGTMVESEAKETPVAEEKGNRTTDVMALRQEVMDVLGENYWPNAEVTADFLEAYGLTTDMYEGFFGEMPMIGANVDTLIIIQAREGQIDAVEQVVRNYREALVNDTKQSPVNMGKIQASRIETLGDYVCFVQLGADVTHIYGESGNEEAVIKHCQEQNELALEAIGKLIS